MPTANVWIESFPLRTYHVTPHGTASVLVLCNWLQEAAGHHAEALDVSMQDLLDDGKAWVLAQLRVEIERLPRWDETVVVETWPSGLERLRATREFVLRTDADGPVATATSAWLVIDTDQRRPVRPPQALFTLETPDRSAPLPHDFADLPALDRTDHARTFDVRYHDLDLNRHVNNVRYAEWAIETLPPKVHDSHRCTGLALQFRAETTMGDTVHATAQVDDPADDNPADDERHVRHALRANDRTVARAVTRWARR
jgi:acyl-ACP thioesterase